MGTSNYFCLLLPSVIHLSAAPPLKIKAERKGCIENQAFVESQEHFIPLLVHKNLPFWMSVAGFPIHRERGLKYRNRKNNRACTAITEQLSFCRGICPIGLYGV